MRHKILIIFLYLVLTSMPALAADSEVIVDADEITSDDVKKVMNASGNVFIQKDDMRIWTEKVKYDKSASIIDAPGRITINKGFTGTGEHLLYNVNSKEGHLDKGELNFNSPDKMKRKFFWGDDITILDNENFVIKRGGMSSCEGECKSWRIEASDIKIVDGDYFTAWHAKLYAGSMPVLYTPFFTGALKKERKSGFLTPTLGYSDKNGGLVTVPYYLVIDASRDATFTFKYRSKNSTGLESQYRYMLSDHEQGEVNLSVFDNFDRNRWYYYPRWKHSRMDEYNLKIDLGTLNHSDYFKEYGEKTDIESIPYLRSTGFIEYEKERNLYSANVFGSYKTGVAGDSFQKLELKKDGYLRELYSNLFFTYNASLAGFMSGSHQVFGRGVAEPQMIYRWNSGNFGVYGQGRVRLDYYTRGPSDKELVDRSFAMANVGGYYDKSYIINDKYVVFSTFKVEGQLPTQFNDYKVYEYDIIDVPDTLRKIKYTFENRWYEEKSGATITYLSLYQEYLPYERDEKLRFSDVNLNFIYYIKTLSLGFQAAYDHGKNKLRSFSLSSGYSAGLTTLTASYVSYENTQKSVNFDLSAKYKNLALITGVKYDIKNQALTEATVAVEYSGDCYSLSLGYSRKGSDKFNNREDKVLFNVNLFGLGELKHSF